jgi:hypothetical protein
VTNLFQVEGGGGVWLESIQGTGGINLRLSGAGEKKHKVEMGFGTLRASATFHPPQCLATALQRFGTRKGGRAELTRRFGTRDGGVGLSVIWGGGRRRRGIWPGLGGRPVEGGGERRCG